LNKAIDSLHESKTDLEICRELAPRLGISHAFFDISEDDLLRLFASRKRDIPDYERLKQEGVLKIKLEEPVVSFKEQIADPENNPFPTLSGKIEIDCDHLREMENPRIPSVPKYISHDENYDSPLADRYPLQLLTAHLKTRAHSTWYNIPWMKEIETQTVWINPVDAASRGIREGMLVDVFNDRGRVRIQAKVTERIMPGVVNVCQGAWFSPDKNGVDLGGCANVLTKNDLSPGGGVPMNSALVQVEAAPVKVQEKLP